MVTDYEMIKKYAPQMKRGKQLIASLKNIKSLIRYNTLFLKTICRPLSRHYRSIYVDLSRILPACLLTCLLARLSAFACLPTFLPACLPDLAARRLATASGHGEGCQDRGAARDEGLRGGDVLHHVQPREAREALYPALRHDAVHGVRVGGHQEDHHGRARHQERG